MKYILMLITATVIIIASPVFAGSSVNLLEPAELQAMLGDDNVIILDVRTGRDWSTSEFKIPGAIRTDGKDFAQWGNSLPKDKKIVLYCA